MKSKSNIVSMLILFVMALISLPLQNLTGNSVSISPIQTAYVTNESGTELVFDALTAENAAFSCVSFLLLLISLWFWYVPIFARIVVRKYDHPPFCACHGKPSGMPRLPTVPRR